MMALYRDTEDGDRRDLLVVAYDVALYGYVRVTLNGLLICVILILKYSNLLRSVDGIILVASDYEREDPLARAHNITLD